MDRRFFSFALLVSLCSLPALVNAESPKSSLRVMSFNIRYGTANDGDNHWEKRKDFVAETVSNFRPDLLGTQETMKFQRDFLEKALPGYESFGAGREDGKDKGESAAIFFLKDRFEKLDGGNFWLSETPDKAGSRGWDARIMRVTSWVKLKDKQADGKILFFFNTHFDHIGKQARIESAKLMHAQIRSISADHPVIVTGDFNAAEGSEPYQALFTTNEPQLLLVDTYRKFHPQKQDDEKTAGGFRIDDKTTGRIDWIANTPNLKILFAEIDRTNKEGRTPSDHFPINAIFEWK